ncbi:MAG: hypothetical protein IKS10_07015 [Lachnospiraceae bacterium]|nr:hypothetical protein [Lachnospiraceae bacterium]
MKITKRIGKCIAITLGLLLGLYILFVTEECIRIMVSPVGARPLIVLSEQEDELTRKYKSVGFTVENDLFRYTDDAGNASVRVCGETIRMGGAVLWGWIE